MFDVSQMMYCWNPFATNPHRNDRPQQLCKIETSSNTHIENRSFAHNRTKNSIDKNTTKIEYPPEI